MKRLSLFVVIALVFALMTPAFAAPLFPDVPDQHWARDAVADLAAKGILEGYPDGTFKGDRAATRWEMAMALQRLLAKMEAAHATFATKSDLEALRALVNNLKDELDALGVRVKNLEENVSALDKRVTELERITFEGDFVARFVTIGLKNTGNRSALGTWAADAGGWNGAFAHFPGANNMFNWRPLTNGSGLTSRARLGIKVKVNKDIDAGIRLAAYTSMGDSIIDAYWGVTAPYSSNPFTTDVGSNGVQNLNNLPWTKMTFDKFWIEHKPTNTMFIAGSIEKTNFDSFLLANINNPGIDGRDRTRFADMNTSKDKKGRVSSWNYYEDEDTYLPYFGVKVNGKAHLISDMKWEAMYSQLPNENIFVKPTLWGFNLDWKVKDQYTVKLNFARVSESTGTLVGSPQAYAPARLPLGFAGLVGLGTEWTDPFDQTTVAATKRPMRTPVGLPGAGLIGLQGQSMWGLSFNHRFDPSDIRVVLAYGGTNYKPSLESGYNVDGSHYRIGLGWTNKPNTLDIDVEYVSTDAYYDAFQVRYPLQGLTPGLNMWNVPTFSYYGNGYQLHDSDMYPNNRNGLRFGIEYRFSNGNGRANLRGDFLQQNTTSDPHRPVDDAVGALYGMKPGFIDPIFHTLATNVAGDPRFGGTPTVNGVAAVLPATPRGKVDHFGGGIEYKFAPSPFKANVQYDAYRFKRDSGVANAATNVAKWNHVNLRHDALKLGLAYAFSDKFSLRGGFDWGRMYGYHAIFNSNWRNAGTNVVDSTQTSPYLGFDYDIAKNTQWCFDIRLYNQNDKLNTNFNGLNNAPESFSAVQMMTQFKVKF